MTTSALRIGTALLGAVLLLPPALAQDRGDERTLRHAEDGATTTLTARPEGDAWRVELTRGRASDEGTRSEQRLQLTFPRTPDVDRKIDELFQDPPDDPAEWVQRIEDLAHVDIDVDGEDLPDGEELRELAERMRDELRQGFEEARRELRELLGEREDEGAASTETTADRVWMKDGARVSGEVLSMDATSVRMKTGAGEVALPRSEVRRIELASDARAQVVLGVSISDQPGGGARIRAVREGTPAARAGLRPGDVIVSFDRQPVTDVEHLRRVIAAHEPGDTVTLTIRRGDAQLDLQVDLTSMPITLPPDVGSGPY